MGKQMQGKMKNIKISEDNKKFADVKNEHVEGKLLQHNLEKNTLMKGTSFNLSKNEDKSIILESSEEIELHFDKCDNGLCLKINPLAKIDSTDLSITKFNEPIYKFEDNYSNFEKLTPSKDGKINFKQDVSKDHILFIQTNPTTYILTEDGWNIAGVGTWNPKTRKATLFQGGNATIDIQTDNVILNGLQSNGEKYNLNGQVNSLVNGILINGRERIAICNFEIYNSNTAIRILNSTNIIIKDNSIHNNANYGVYIESSERVKILCNDFDNNDVGVYIYRNNEKISVSKNYINNSRYAIYVSYLNELIEINENTITESDNNYNYIYSILISDTNSGVRIEDNKISMNKNIRSLNDNEFVGIYSYSSDKVLIKNNSINISNNVIQSTSGYNYNYFYGMYLSYYNGEGTKVNNNIVKIENNTISGENASEYVRMYGIYYYYGYKGEFTNNKVKISNNNISVNNDSDNYLYQYIRGVYLSSGYYNKFIDNNIEVSNNALNSNNSSIYSEVSGLTVSSMIKMILSKNCIIIKNNKVVAGRLSGIYVNSNSKENCINDNKVILDDNIVNDVYAIYLGQYNKNNILQNNELLIDKGRGIHLDYYNWKNIIVMNKICCKGDYGIYLNNSNRSNEFKDNLIKGNCKYGIVLMTLNSKNTFELNNIIENAIGLIIYAGNDLNCFIENNFINPSGNNSFNYGNDNKFNGNYFSDWNGKVPYNVNRTIDYHPRKHPICKK